MTAAVTEIRDATPADVPHILRLIHELARFEKEPDAVKATEADLLRDGFGAQPKFEVRLAWMAGRAVAFTFFYTTYSTWEGRPGIHLEDLFVAEEARGAGLGRRMMIDLAQIAVARGYTRLGFNVLDWNPARGFYQTLGIDHLQEWLPYRISGTALRGLAAAGES
jgi:GNAT superfamily N-acetyltransferase